MREPDYNEIQRRVEGAWRVASNAVLADIGKGYAIPQGVIVGPNGHGGLTVDNARFGLFMALVQHLVPQYQVGNIESSITQVSPKEPWQDGSGGSV